MCIIHTMHRQLQKIPKVRMFINFFFFSVSYRSGGEGGGGGGGVWWSVIDKCIIHACVSHARVLLLRCALCHLSPQGI